MTLEETGRILALLSENWKKDGPGVTRATLVLWQRCLGDLPYQLVDAATIELILVGSPFCPKISEVRRHALGLLLSEKEVPGTTDAWEMLRQAISDNYWHPSRAWASLPPVVRRVGQAIGWYDLTNGESAVLRAHFLKLYEQEREAEMQEALLPAGFKELRQDLRREYGKSESLPAPRDSEPHALQPPTPEEEPTPEVLQRWTRLRETMTGLPSQMSMDRGKR
jgi:hypothetical protein